MSFLKNFLFKYILVDKPLRDIEELITKGEYDKALHVISDHLQQESTDNHKRIKLSILQLRIANLQNDYQFVLSKGNILFNEAVEFKKFPESFTLLFLITEALRFMGKFDEYQNFLLKGKEILEQVDNSTKDYLRGKSILQYLQATLDSNKGLYESAITNYKKVIEIKTTLNEIEAIIDSYYHIAYVYLQIGNNDEAENYAEKGLQLSKEINNIHAQQQMYGILGLIKSEAGHKEGLTYLLKSLELAELSNNKYSLAMILNNIGYHYHARESDFISCLSYYKRAEKISRQFGYKRTQAITTGNIAEVYQFQGHLDKALNTSKKALKLYQELFDEENLSIVDILLHLGKIYREKGEKEKSKEYFFKADSLALKYNNLLYSAQAIFYLLEIAIDDEDLELANKYLARFREIQKTISNHSLLNAGVDIAEALVLKISTRMSDRMKALELLKDYSKRYTFWLFPKVIYGHLIDLLFFEYTTSQSVEVLNDLENTISDLNNFAQQQNSFLLMSLSLVLKAKLLSIKKDKKQALELLAKAQKIADRKGLIRIARHISTEFDQLLQESNEKNKLGDDFTDIIQHISGSKELKEPKFQKDNPILFLIISKAGLTIFSYTFSDTMTIDDQLLGGFLQAIIAFGNEVFSAKTSIDRIMYKDYIIALNALEDVDSFLFCYVFKGSSYPALFKLNQFIMEFNNCQECKNELQKCVEESREVSGQGKDKINLIIPPIFKR